MVQGSFAVITNQRFSLKYQILWFLSNGIFIVPRMWYCMEWCTCVCIHVVLLVAHYHDQFGAVFPSDVELRIID